MVMLYCGVIALPRFF